jgi:hypothetical protein
VSRRRIKPAAAVPIIRFMDPSQIERRTAEADRRRLVRAIRCESCGVLLTFDRRGSVVGMFRSASAMPVHGGPVASETHRTRIEPRCVVCNRSLLPPP